MNPKRILVGLVMGSTSTLMLAGVTASADDGAWHGMAGLPKSSAGTQMADGGGWGPGGVVPAPPTAPCQALGVESAGCGPFLPPAKTTQVTTNLMVHVPRLVLDASSVSMRLAQIGPKANVAQDMKKHPEYYFRYSDLAFMRNEFGTAFPDAAFLNITISSTTDTFVVNDQVEVPTDISVAAEDQAISIYKDEVSGALPAPVSPVENYQAPIPQSVTKQDIASAAADYLIGDVAFGTETYSINGGPEKPVPASQGLDNTVEVPVE